MLLPDFLCQVVSLSFRQFLDPDEARDVESFAIEMFFQKLYELFVITRQEFSGMSCRDCGFERLRRAEESVVGER